MNYVSFVECDYSYAELMELDKWLFDFFTKNENKSFLNTLHVDGWNINIFGIYKQLLLNAL